MKHLLLFLILFLFACTTATPSTPDTIATLKSACNSACTAPQNSTITLHSGTIYTTDEAICIKRNDNGTFKLYCGTCVCESAYGPIPKQLLQVETTQLVHCSFTNTGTGIDAACSRLNSSTNISRS